MQATTAAQIDTKAPLTRDGQEIEVHVSRVTISLIRVTAGHYRVVTLEGATRRRIDWASEDFTANRLPGGCDVETEAREFARRVYRDFHADAETPAQVVARMTTLAA